MKLSYGFLGSLMLCPILLGGCHLRKNKVSSEVKAEARKAGGLDVNDVSILFPLPKKPDDISRMLPINFVNEDGKAPISPGLFQSLFKHHDYEVEVDGKKTRRVSGASFTGKDRNEPGHRPTDFGPYDQINDWKIIAMRFDPCAATPTNNLLGHGPREVRTSFDPSSCLLQLRLTAQPILPSSREIQDFRGPVLGSDNALHLLFTLDEAQAKALYADLLKFKESCGDVTSAMPLMIHPCLKIESQDQGINGPQHTEIQRLIKAYAKQLVAIAMMATHDGDDPWVFMNGRIESGTFIHLPIAAVHKDDPKTLTIGQNGNVVEPFSNGFYQQINLQSLADFKTLVRVAPVPIPSKVNHSLLEEYNLSEAFKADGADTKSLHKVTAIENPLRTDFFSTDCVSCHTSSTVSLYIREKQVKAVYDLDPEKFSHLLYTYGFGGIVASRENLDQVTALWSRRSYEEMFQVQGSYTLVADPYARASRVDNETPTSLIHFGYLGARPQISQRAINESALVAKMANSFFGEGREPPNRCDQAKLSVCMQSQETSHRSDWGTEGFNVSACLAKICPDRAREVKALFPEISIKSYRVKKAFTGIDNRDYFSSEAKSKVEANAVNYTVGMVLVGEIVKGWDQDFELKPAFAQEVTTVGGEKLLVNEALELPKGVDWQEWFEVIEPTAALDMKASPPAATEIPTCRDASSDRDAKGIEDGWGWEDGHSCRVKK